MKRLAQANSLCGPHTRRTARLDLTHLGIAQKVCMNDQNLDTWLIVPLFNEAEVVHDVIVEARQSFAHVVCIDDGSTDGSAQEALTAGAVVVQHPVNLGQGAAIQTGIEFALQQGAEYFVTFDSDGQHSREDAVRMVARLRHEPLDIVVGSRFLDARTNASLLKKMVLRAAVLFERINTGVALTDAHNGLRAFNRTAASAIRITQDRMAHASEIVAQIGTRKLRYAEEPVHILYTDYSRAKGQSIWNSVNILSDLLLK